MKRRANEATNFPKAKVQPNTLPPIEASGKGAQRASTARRFLQYMFSFVQLAATWDTHRAGKQADKATRLLIGPRTSRK